MILELVGREFYILYKFVIRELVEFIKLRIVFDVLVKVNEKSFLLNDCLEKGLVF